MNNKRYEILDNFIFQTPLFNIDKDNINVFKDKAFGEAIYLASPDLHDQVYTDKNIDFIKLPFKIRNSVLKYILRIKSRCTPFGLFAGCGVGTIGTVSKITLKSEDFISKTRLDMGIISAISRLISSDPYLLEKIKWIPNDSLLTVENSFLRYIEFKYIKNKRHYFLVEIEYDEHLIHLIEFAKNDGRVKSLISFLVNEGFDETESLEYLKNLIESQVLVADSEAFATLDDDPIDILISRIVNLQDEGMNNTLVSILTSIKQKLKQSDKENIGFANTSIFKGIKESISNIGIEYDERYLLQTDLTIKQNSATLSDDFYSSAKEGILLLNKITPKNENILLEKFKKDFFERYENEEIPILEALDVDIGIGFGIDSNDYASNLLLKDLGIQVKNSNNEQANLFSEILLRKINQRDKNWFTEEIEITDADLSHLEENWDDLPDTLSSLIEVISAGSNLKKPLLLMRSVSGSSAANLISRFCHTNEDIKKLVEQIVVHEESLIPKDTVLAEIVHIPQARLGNVILRPVLRNFEIPYLTNTKLDASKTINLNDIVISVKDGKKIKIKSKQLNKFIQPILTSAHNYSSDSLPIYQFLCNLQNQDKRNYLSFSWTGIKKDVTFYPRVIYKNIIISPATWFFKKDDLKILPQKDSPDFESIARSILVNKRIPSKVYVVSGDNKLFIDFTDLILLDLFFIELARGFYVVEEYLFNHDNMLIKSESGIHTNQIIASFIKPNTIN
ncbi:lantibiotic dehydratase family protein [Pedobacter jeongneungensis]|uniref:lantibiotic dehydratase family protein n=1 Tax=Pedobacter jeongneungensis TaxID=947309 RepID=UPI0004698F5A|nr:lantibiotic dehydratase family protein [Pedobacter jeongneungensis]